MIVSELTEINYKMINYLLLLTRTARIEVMKLSSCRAVPVVVLNKHRRLGDNDGCKTVNSKA